MTQIWGSLTDQLTFVFLLVEEEAKNEGIGPDDFERRLQGDGVATEASQAFLKEVALFFRKYDQEGLARVTDEQIKMKDQTKSYVDKLIQTGRFDSVMTQMLEEMDKKLTSPDGSLSPNSSASSDGSPGQTATLES